MPMQGGAPMSEEQMMMMQQQQGQNAGNQGVDAQQLLMIISQKSGIPEEQLIQQISQIAEKNNMAPEEVLMAMAQQMQQSGQGIQGGQGDQGMPPEDQMMAQQQAQQGQQMPMGGEGSEMQGQSQEPEKVTVNIERGELLVDPNTTHIIQKFDNPNRFEPHNKNKYKEPHGNFVEVEEGLVVVPKKMAGRYERGNKLTRRSIVLEIMKQQEQNPEQNDPDTARADMKAKKGAFTIGPGPEGDVFTVGPDLESYAPISGFGNWVAGNGLGKIEMNRNAQGAQKNTDADRSTTFGKKEVKETEPGKSIGNKKDYSAAIGALSSMLPIVDQLSRLNTRTGLDHQYNTRLDEGKMYLDSLPDTLNTDHAQYQASRAADTISRMMMNYAGNNQPVLGSLTSQMLNNSSAAALEKVKAETQLKSQKKAALSQYVATAGASDQAARTAYMNENRMDMGAKDNLRAQGFANMATNLQQTISDYNKIKALNASALFTKIDPNTMQLITDLPDFQTILQGMLKNPPTTTQKAKA
jgi:hypothetical protein